MGVIDGGGNRTEMDRKLYSLADLVLLPFRDSHEDIRTVVRDLEMFPRAYAIPTQWPTNAWQREAAEGSIDQMLAPHRDRILQPIYSLAASKLLLQTQLPAALPTPLANACRAAAHQVLDLLQIPIGDGNEEAASPRTAPTSGARAAKPAVLAAV
jgi:hypothetical protein